MTFPSGINESIESRFSKLASKKNKEGKDIISLGLGEPDFNTPKPIIEEAYKALLEGKSKYSSPMGILKLRRKISDYLKINNKIFSEIDNIIITNGAKMALTLALSSILKKNTQIMNITPCYPSYVPQILLAEHESKITNFNLNSDNFSLNFDRLEKTISKQRIKILLINFPNNPTGKMLNKNELNQLVEIVFKYKLIVITDEVYDRLIFSKKKYRSIASFKKISNQVIVINSFSKSFAMTGWRVGFMVANKSIIKKACKIQQHINTNVPEFIQLAAYKALTINPKHLEKYNTRLLNNYNYLIRRFDKTINFPVSKSEGGLFAFVNISKYGKCSDIFCRDLIDKTNVACTPGIFFGTNWDKFVRVSLAIDQKSFQKAIELIIKFVNDRNSD